MKYSLLTALFISLAFTSCRKPPEACIEMDTTTASVGQTITFTSCSKRSLSWVWSFSGPVGAPENTTGSSDEMYQHAFSVPGTYTVQLDAYEKFSFLGEMNSTTATFVIQ